MFEKLLQSKKLGKTYRTLRRYKYFITVGIFVLWVAFFDRINLISHVTLQRAKQNLIEEKAYYEHGIEESNRLHHEIQSNLEKYAREQYFMHKEDEDVFVFR